MLSRLLLLISHLFRKSYIDDIKKPFVKLFFRRNTDEIYLILSLHRGTFATFSFMQIRSRCSKILLLARAYQGFPSFMNFRVNLPRRRSTKLFTSFVKRSRNFASST